ncbi:hypothetical protein GCM10025331_40630 [Actinoplanes utahensis]|nr:hypothetical protein Aut01nite_72480 [Actinoplanes utahensis]
MSTARPAPLARSRRRTDPARPRRGPGFLAARGFDREDGHEPAASGRRKGRPAAAAASHGTWGGPYRKKGFVFGSAGGDADGVAGDDGQQDHGAAVVDGDRDAVGGIGEDQ